ncbi:unnamed protein product [Caenorhabditis brenneri]
MSNSKPLGYDSLKAVIPYMKMNVRYEMSSRLPFIKNLDRLLPARFDVVEFDVYQTRINDTTYRLGLVRQYPEGYEVPMTDKEVNDAGGRGMDMTEHGFNVLLHRHAITPGDIDIAPGQRIPHDGRVANANRVLFERHVRVYEKALTLRQQQGDDFSNIAQIGGDGFDDLLGHNLLAPDDREQRLLDYLLTFSAESIRMKLHDFRARLVPFHCRQFNTPLPFVPMIQLTISSPRGKEIYRHAYNMKLGEAMKELNTKLLGGRNGVHHIRYLILKQPVMIIRLPVGLRFTVGAVSIAGSAELNLEALQPIVEESSFPLNMLRMTGSFLHPADYEHPKVRSARTLKIHNDSEVLDVLPILRSLQNQNVILKCHSSRLQEQQQVILVENWIDGDKEIGKSLSLELMGMLSVRNLRTQIMFRFMGNRDLANNVTMPMRNGNNLQVKFIPLNNRTSRLNRRVNWRVEMKVLPGAVDEEY